MTRRPIATAALTLAAAFLAGHVARTAFALSVRNATASRTATPNEEEVSTERPDSERISRAPTFDSEEAVVPAPAPHVVEEIPAAATDATPPGGAGSDRTPEPSPWLDTQPLAASLSSESAPIEEPFDVAAARHSARNFEHPTALQSTPFRFLAYRSAGRFEVTVGDLACHYRASPTTWALLLAARRGRHPAVESGAPADPDALDAERSAALRAVVDQHLLACETLRRDLWTLLRDGSAASAPPALDLGSIAAVLAGERGVSVVRAGADAQLDRMLDDLERLETTARSDVEFLLR